MSPLQGEPLAHEERAMLDHHCAQIRENPRVQTADWWVSHFERWGWEVVLHVLGCGGGGITEQDVGNLGRLQDAVCDRSPRFRGRCLSWTTEGTWATLYWRYTPASPAQPPHGGT